MSSQLTGPREDRDLKVLAFARSEVFARTFREGMDLVESTASYLDGDGREDAKLLGRQASLAYASASMRITTQLMQLASWLLVLRAVREGDMEIEDAREAKYRLPPVKAALGDLDLSETPAQLLSLKDEAERLYERVARIDDDLFAQRPFESTSNDAASQLRSLREAFGDA
ncbi:MAG: DUF1465 family protein [Pseudomonadota bacterium]